MRKKIQVQFKASVLLQIDIEGHSTWFASARSKPEVVRARIELAERMHGVLQKNKFCLLSWKGDGGVYTSPSNAGSGNLDFSVEAANTAAVVFSEWRKEKNDRRSLRLRISIHYASDIYVHPKSSGYWASDDLNVFIKFEREIGVSGAIAVTDIVYKNLSTVTQDKFTVARKLHLGAIPGHATINEVHYSPISTEAAVNKKDPLGFFEWLRLSKLPGTKFSDDLIGPASHFRASIAEACILFAAPSPDSGMSLDFNNQSDQIPEEHRPHDIKAEEIEIWDRIKNEVSERSKLQGREDGKKVSPIRIVRPLSDIPLASISYKIETWSRARAFHKLLEQNPYILQRLAPHALKILEDGSKIPGIACCHMIVRTSDKIDETPTVLLCQRQTKGPEDMYQQGRWSLTCEEQLRPGEDISSCVNRGLAEEFLGSQGAAGLTVRVLGAVLEPSILNLALIVLVDVPMTFAEIVDSWQLSVDKDEHCQLAHFKLDRTFYTQLTQADELSQSVRAALRSSHPETFAVTKHWKLHPTTLVRTAFALWALEMLVPPNAS